MQSTCTDGARKKAKYLQDIEGEPKRVKKAEGYRIEGYSMKNLQILDTASGNSTPVTSYSPQPSMTTPNLNTFVPEVAPFQQQNFLNAVLPGI